jgi:hypothetical protein
MSNRQMAPLDPPRDDAESSDARKNGTGLWKLCKYYVHVHLVSIAMCAWLVYMDAPPYEGALYEVSMYLGLPALLVFVASPLITLCIAALCVSYGRKYLYLAAYDGALTIVQYLVMFPAYS